MPSLRSINREAGTNFRRWKELTKAVTIEWHPQIHRGFAQKDGLTPDDFVWLPYPVSNVRMEHGVGEWNLTYRAEMPPETPQVNVYFRPEEREDGKDYEAVQFGDEVWYSLKVRGTALSRVKFSLIDLADFEVLHESNTDHIKGELTAGLAEGRDSLIWKRLTPGTTLHVRLDAFPLFLPYNNPDTGDGGTAYSNVNNGYLGGDVVSSREYTLTMTPDGLPEPPHLLIDGQPKPEYVIPENPEDVASRLEGDRIMAEERAQREAAEEAARREVEESNRLHNERMERERAEQEAEQARQLAEAETQRARERQEQEAADAQAAEERAKLAGVPEYTLLDQMRDGLNGKDDAEVADILAQVKGINEEYAEAAQAYAAERGIKL